jgi:formylglycine-generating enzyme required for sulfatase activity
MEMIYVAPGSFMMGSPSTEEGRFVDEIPCRVTLTKGYWLGKYEVTQVQWMSVMSNNPSYFKGDEKPVENVTWEECQNFIKKVNKYAECGARLPTEAEWEYACRAGTTTPYSWGYTLNGDRANCDGNFPYGTTRNGPYRESTVRVGSYSQNNWGFCDMHGNVYEWCMDWYGSYSSKDKSDPIGSVSGEYRVVRGGGWNDFARRCRSSDRGWSCPDLRYNYVGLRLACSEVPNK